MLYYIINRYINVIVQLLDSDRTKNFFLKYSLLGYGRHQLDPIHVVFENAMALIGLPNELLIEIIDYLRPVNNSKPVTGLTAAWKPYLAYQEESVSSKPDSSTPEVEVFTPLSSNATLKALSS